MICVGWQVEDVEPEALEQLLRFMYTDECEEAVLESMADHLLVAATKCNTHSPSMLNDNTDSRGWQVSDRAAAGAV